MKQPASSGSLPITDADTGGMACTAGGCGLARIASCALLTGCFLTATECTKNLISLDCLWPSSELSAKVVPLYPFSLCVTWRGRCKGGAVKSELHTQSGICTHLGGGISMIRGLALAVRPAAFAAATVDACPCTESKRTQALSSQWRALEIFCQNLRGATTCG